MFSDALETANDYCRPIKTISRVYKSEEIIPQTATMFFVNGEGTAVTSRKVAEEIMCAGKLNAKYESFKKERDSIPGEYNIRIETNRMERRYGYNKGETKIQLRYNFSRCFEKIERLGVELHPTMDVALIRFNGFGTPLFHSHCSFSKALKKPRVGMSICRLGFPVTEFTDFAYFRERDDIQWTTSGIHTVNSYPADGMIVEVRRNEEGRPVSFAVTGLPARGFCGAPVLDAAGVLIGMVSGTAEKIIDGEKVTYTECVSADCIRSFLQEKNIAYFEA